MRLLSPIAANIFLIASAFGYGSFLGKLFPDTFSLLDRLSFTLLGGFGILGTILFCAGQVWFTRTAILSILLLGVVALTRLRVGARSSFRTLLANVPLPVAPLLIVSTVILVTAIGGLAAPTGDMNYDAIGYHYLAPKVWLRDAVIRPVPDEMQTSFPVIVETQYAALMSMGGQRGPQFFSVISLISLLLIVASLAIRLGVSPSGVWWTLALIATMPAVYRGTYEGFIDVLFAAFVLAAARIAFDAKLPGQYALFGIFCGICMGTKYTGIIAWVLLTVCLFLMFLSRPSPYFRDALKYFGIASAIAIAFAAPVYIRNWIVLGCPIYPPLPVLYKFVDVKYFPVEAVKRFQAYILRRGVGHGRGFGAYFLLPFNLTYHTADFHGAGGIGIAPLALAPIGLIHSLRGRFPRAIAVLAFLLTTAWFITQQESRFLIAVYAIAAIFAVIGWEDIAHLQSKVSRILAALVIAISILYGLGQIIPARLDDVQAALSKSFETRRRYRDIPRLRAFDYINNDPSVEKVLILNAGVAAYYLDKPYVKPFGRWGEITLPGVTDISEAMAKLSALRVTHVLDVKSEYGVFDLQGNVPNLVLVFETNDERIYRVD